jgi:nucleotide-binding universal stress UspA family protein
VLLATDGSAGAGKALGHLLELRSKLRDPDSMQLHLLNVQRPVSGDVSSFVAARSLGDYHRERSEKALQPARDVLKAAGLGFSEHREVGDPGPTIAAVAATQGCDLIVVGANGGRSHTAGLLGSVAASTLERASMPVLVVRA